MAANYVAVHGGGAITVSDSADDPGNGLFGEHSFHRLGSIDGTSHTLAIGERVISQQGNNGAIWMRSTNRTGDSGNGTSVAGICHRSILPNNLTNPNGFSSNHPGGVLFVAADASLRFIRDDVDGFVYEHLGQRNDRAVLQSNVDGESLLSFEEERSQRMKESVNVSEEALSAIR
jgi:Protein of unknown function (DUF1559)